MFVVSGLNTVFCSASSVIVITAATSEESLPEADDAEAESAKGKMDPIVFSPKINATTEILAIATNNVR
jgi:hypothetical protein